ncbi:MAG: transcriptional regulator PpsR [Pseudomonadota bacterium]
MSARDGKSWPRRTLPQIAPEVLTEILAKATDLAIMIDEAGTVMSVLINPNNRSFGRLDHWQSRNIRDFLTSESVPKLDARLARTKDVGDAAVGIELNHSDNARWEFPIRYTLHKLDGGATLMLGRDLRPIAEVQLQLAKAQMALERDHEAQREFDTRYRVLLNTTSDAIVFVSTRSGRVIDLNKVAADSLGISRDSLLGGAFASEFENKGDDDLMDSLAQAANGSAVELRTRRSRTAVRISPTVFRAGGERMFICRIDHVAQRSEPQSELNSNLVAFYRSGAEAIVFADRNGIVTAANDSFLELIEAADLSAVKGNSLGDYLARGAVDIRILTENAARVGFMRMYATKLVGMFGASVPAEVSVTYLTNAATPFYVFVLRDVSRAGEIRASTTPQQDDSGRSVVDLVGATTLKDIVAETTDVIEKMCIETAVELTNNNRVAAAEMLGLSRQSLYVKLRKYDLL